ncbi:MAG: c-type cytochrome [Acetobacteraceae bacterium]|nr:c-type cytochrome [Acetobacteraceae bacterium]
MVAIVTLSRRHGGCVRSGVLAALGAASWLSASVVAATAAGAPAGDPAAGRAAFGTCQACHSTTPGRNGVGPTLDDVVGRQAATVGGYNYSPAMRATHITWDGASLNRFLSNPQSVVHGTKMFVAAPNPTTRQNIIAYLATLK